MNPMNPTGILRFLFTCRRIWQTARLSALVGVAILLGLNSAQATFHVWAVTELYSSPDGSVQFIKLINNSAFTTEYFLGGHVITCIGASGVSNTFTFPTNLPAISTLNKTFLIGTANLATLPGGVTPDYVFTNQTPFLFLNSGVTNTVGIVNSIEVRAAYTNLPTDGVLSLQGLGSSLLAATNAPRNFSDQSNSIVPVRFDSAQPMGNNLVMTFRTATGVNGAAGPTYGVEYKNLLSDANWTLLSTVPGDGATHSVSNATTSAAQRFFRLNVP